MSVRWWLVPTALLLVLSGCQRAEAPPARAETPATEPDVHSFARPELARVTHVALDLRADFDARVLAGQARLTLERAPGADAVVLDSRGLAIDCVADASGEPLRFELGPEDAVRGRALTVSLPDGVREIVVSYRTSPDAEALQWLAPDADGRRRSTRTSSRRARPSSRAPGSPPRTAPASARPTRPASSCRATCAP